MKRLEHSSEKRKEKIAERQNLEKRKQIKDKRFYVIEDDELIDDILYDGEPLDETDD